MNNKDLIGCTYHNIISIIINESLPFILRLCLPPSQQIKINRKCQKQTDNQRENI